MKATCRRTDLLDAVKNACRIAPKSCTDPIISNLRIDCKSASIEVTATDYEEIYRETIPAFNEIRDQENCEQYPSILVNADKLKKVLSKSKAETVEIETTVHNWFNMKLGKITTKLPGADSSAFPECEFKKPAWKFKLSAAHLKEITEMVLYSIGENESRKSLMGLNIRQKDRQVMFQGADAYRIARYFLPLANDFEEVVIFPKKAFSKSNQIFNWQDSDWYFDDDCLIIQNDTQKYQSRLIEAEYPNLDSLTQAGGQPCRIDSKAALEAMEMMQVLTDTNPNAIAKLSLNGNNSLTMETQKIEFGEGRVEIDCEYENTTQAWGLTICLLKEAVAIFKKVESFDMVVAGPDKPILFLDPDKPEYLAVLMPVKIQW
jgi:DNA polymerase III beta subunit